MAETELRWHVRLDASVEPVLGVVAPDWYHARALAVMVLHVEMHRLHVEQLYTDEKLFYRLHVLS